MLVITRANARMYSEVRLVGEGMNEIVPISVALSRAEDEGLDLVMVGEGLNPPVCRIQDFKKLQYEAKKAKSKLQRTSELKEIQLRVNIQDHDLQTKLDAIKRFLERGDKVKISIRLKGRERDNPRRAEDLMKRVTDAVPCKVSRVMGMPIIAILEQAK